MNLYKLTQQSQPFEWSDHKPDFPKPIMTRTELVKMGFSMSTLKRVCEVYENANYAIAWKVNPDKLKSPWKYNTEALWILLEKMKQQGRL